MESAILYSLVFAFSLTLKQRWDRINNSLYILFSFFLPPRKSILNSGGSMQNHKVWQEFNGLVMGVKQFIYPYMCADGVENIMSKTALTVMLTKSLPDHLHWCHFDTAFSPSLHMYPYNSYMYMHGENRLHTFSTIFPQNKEIALHIIVIVVIVIITTTTMWNNFTATDFTKWKPLLPFMVITAIAIFFPHGSYSESLQSSAPQGYPTFHQPEEREKGRELEMPWF